MKGRLKEKKTSEQKKNNQIKLAMNRNLLAEKG